MVAQDVNTSEMAVIVSEMHGADAPKVIDLQVAINERVGNADAAALWREIGLHLPQIAGRVERRRHPRERMEARPRHAPCVARSSPATR